MSVLYLSEFHHPTNVPSFHQYENEEEEIHHRKDSILIYSMIYGNGAHAVKKKKNTRVDLLKIAFRK